MKTQCILRPTRTSSCRDVEPSLCTENQSSFQSLHFHREAVTCENAIFYLGSQTSFRSQESFDLSSREMDLYTCHGTTSRTDHLLQV